MRQKTIFLTSVRWFAIGVLAAGMAACNKQEPQPAPLKRVKVFEVGAAVESSSGGATAADERAAFRDPSALSFDAPGRVMAVLVRTGDKVAPGQALMRLDPRDLALSESSARSQLAAAQAELAAAEADFRRYTDLHAKGFISAAEHQRRQSQIELARARFEAISDQLGYISLRAIEPGVVRSLHAKEGELIEARQLMLRLALLPSGSEARPNEDAAIKAVPPASTGKSVVRIPLAAIVDGAYVYRIQPSADGIGILEKVAVTLGALDERSAVVISGLARGDRIVAAGTHVLSSQERVRLQ